MVLPNRLSIQFKLTVVRCGLYLIEMGAFLVSRGRVLFRGEACDSRNLCANTSGYGSPFHQLFAIVLTHKAVVTRNYVPLPSIVTANWVRQLFLIAVCYLR